MEIIDESCLWEFMELYEKEFGERISTAEAREMTDRLFTLYELLARPLPSELEQREENLDSFV